MDDRWPAVLVALAPLPACEAESTKDDDDGPAPEGVMAACQAAWATYLACYAGPDPYSPEEACERYVREIEIYGPACQAAQEDVFVCMSELDCADMDDPLPGPCRSIYTAAHADCPELFPYCHAFDYESSDVTCSITGVSCIDDRQYNVACEVKPDGHNCTCAIDDASAGAFTSAFACDDERMGLLAEMHCGFPPGVPRRA